MLVPLYSIQQLPAGRVSVMARPRGGDWLLDEIRALHMAGVDVLVSLLTAPEVQDLDLTEEEALCQQQTIAYFSFPIPDFHVPPFSTSTFRFLQQLNTYLAEGKHVAIHCRQGLGRSVLMAASLLVLNNIVPEEAFDLLSQTRGYSVPETEEQKAWVVAFSHLSH
ncbi:MAG TPA: dual specificity protein phosphatase family protein [Ktedonobacteraceae bacterium]|jgi:protein-tyrosine phosphatase|nr:dual specificity protein phosphatase family protein [Ktedonobacteraceae bacterium]